MPIIKKQNKQGKKVMINNVIEVVNTDTNEKHTEKICNLQKSLRLVVNQNTI